MYSFKQIIVKAREKNNKTQPKPWTNTYTLQLVTLYKAFRRYATLYSICFKKKVRQWWVVGRCYYLDTRQHISYISHGQFSGIPPPPVYLFKSSSEGGWVCGAPRPAWGCPQHTAAAPGGRPPAAESWTSNTLMTHLLNQMYMRTILKQCDCMISIQYTGLCPMFSPSSGWSIITWDIFSLSY